MPKGKKLDDPALRERLCDLLRSGSGRHEAAVGVGVSPAAYRIYYKNNPDFREMVEDAVNASVEPIVKMLREEALLGDLAAAKEYLKHVAPPPRSEVKQVNVKHEHAFDPSQISDISDLRARLEGRSAPVPALEEGEIIEAEIIEDDDQV